MEGRAQGQGGGLTCEAELTGVQTVGVGEGLGLNTWDGRWSL